MAKTAHNHKLPANAPCPCGSGLKCKACCITRSGYYVTMAKRLKDDGYLENYIKTQLEQGGTKVVDEGESK